MEPAPEQQRLDIISEAIARLLKKQDEMEQRLARLETAISPRLFAAPPAEVPPPPPPPTPSCSKNLPRRNPKNRL